MPHVPRPMSPGSSLLALLAVLALILASVAAIIWPAHQLSRDRTGLERKLPRETVCVRGYIFDVLEDGSRRQVFDQSGRSVPCEVRR